MYNYVHISLNDKKVVEYPVNQTFMFSLFETTYKGCWIPQNQKFMFSWSTNTYVAG